MFGGGGGKKGPLYLLEEDEEGPHHLEWGSRHAHTGHPMCAKPGQWRFQRCTVLFPSSRLGLPLASLALVLAEIKLKDGWLDCLFGLGLIGSGSFRGWFRVGL